MKENYTDRYLATPRNWRNPPLDQIEVLPQEMFGKIFELDTEDESKVKDKWKISFQFLIPPLSLDHRTQQRSIDKEQIAPFHVIKKIGNGGFSTVYEAEMLEGYHDFTDIAVS
jgi:hypothetical protein